MRTVLVTGVGAVIGYGILRELRKTRQDLRLVGCDIHRDAVGQHWSDSFHIAPPVTSNEYPTFISNLIDEEKIDLVIPGFEQDITWLNDNRSLFSGRTHLALNTERLIKDTHDKWQFAELLKTSHPELRIPTFLDLGFTNLLQTIGLPIVAKPRISYASKGLRTIRNEAEYLAIDEASRKSYIYQPLVGSNEREFTVSVFSDGSGGVLAEIYFRRTLSIDGSSSKVWTFDDIVLRNIVASLVSYFRPVGSTNLQFRESEGKWYLLEINPRISSSVSFRNGFGYLEATMTAGFFLDNLRPTQPTLKVGNATRYLSEVFTVSEQK